MQDKALVTMGIGPHAEYLAVTRPSMRAYAERWGYTYVEVDSAVSGRPPSWSKIPALKRLLDEYMQVLWIDSDAVIVDASRDLAAHVPHEAWQAMPVHYRHQGVEMGDVPSCGLWLVRPPMQPVLEALWGMTQHINHPWWENAALHDLLGYTYNGAAIFPVRRTRETALYRHTHLLPDGWQSIDYHDECTRAMVVHVPGVEPHAQRLAWLQTWAERAASLEVIDAR